MVKNRKEQLHQFLAFLVAGHGRHPDSEKHEEGHAQRNGQGLHITHIGM